MSRMKESAMDRYEFIQSVMQLPSVRAKIAQVRDQKAGEVARLARAENIPVAVVVETSAGTRPKGRPYARIAIPARVEYGDYETPRTRLLGRVAQS